jgi:single-strand DNA-binding protein
MFNRSVNKVVLVGNLGKDPEMRYMPNGNAVCNFSIATTESWKNKQTGEYENSTEWHNCAVFGKFGEMCGQFLKKGAKVYLEGKLKTEKWNDKTSGQEKSAVKVTVSELQLMDAKEANQGGQQQAPVPQQQYQQAPQQQAPQMAPQQQAQSFGTPPAYHQAPTPQNPPVGSASQQAPQQNGGQQQAPGK